jgi:hypothetical protein
MHLSFLQQNQWIRAELDLTETEGGGKGGAGGQGGEMTQTMYAHVNK